MRTRQASLRGVARFHEPTADEPLIVLIIDELAALTSYVTDREAKRRIGAALSLLLSQGRAVGVTVVAALQDPRKEVLPARDLFPTRVGLRMVDPDQVDMVLGAGARNHGARCDQIPESLPGVGYVGLDGVAEPVRVRFAYLTDTDIQMMVDRYSPQLRAVSDAPRAPAELGDMAADDESAESRGAASRAMSMTVGSGAPWGFPATCSHPNRYTRCGPPWSGTGEPSRTVRRAVWTCGSSTGVSRSRGCSRWSVPAARSAGRARVGGSGRRGGGVGRDQLQQPGSRRLPDLRW